MVVWDSLKINANKNKAVFRLYIIFNLNSRLMLLLALAIAPGLAICVYILYRDVYNREPALNMILSFVLGIVSIVPALAIESAISRFLDHSLFSIIAGAFLGVALVEELCKFAVLRWYSF